MGIVGKVAPKGALGWYMDEGGAERTVERRVRVTAPEPWRFENRPTRRMRTISDRVLAIARGELDEEDDPQDADDPFGGLIPVPDDDHIEVDESWLDKHTEPEPFSSRPPEP
jgi:hypothetical protein